MTELKCISDMIEDNEKEIKALEKEIEKADPCADMAETEKKIEELERDTALMKEESKESKSIKPLFFKESFWCKELGKSFKAGYYTAKTLEEHKAIAFFGTIVESGKKKMEVR